MHMHTAKNGTIYTGKYKIGKGNIGIAEKAQETRSKCIGNVIASQKLWFVSYTIVKAL